MFEIINSAYLWYIPILLLGAYIIKNEKYSYAYINKIDAEANNVNDNYRSNILIAILVFLPLILIAGYRVMYHNAIGDTGLYVYYFNQYPNSVSDVINSNAQTDKMYGWEIISVFIRQYITKEPRMWLLIIASVQGLCLTIIYKLYSTNIAMSAFLFFASTDFLSWMCNGIRQFFVVTLIFLLFPLVKKKKVWSTALFIVAVILLSKVHTSCLIVIPLYLISIGKPFNKFTLVMIVICVLSVVFVGQFTTLLGDALESTEYSNLTTNMKSTTGASPLRAALYSVPAILAIIYREKVKKAPQIIGISVNMSLISMGIYVISVFTSGLFIGRLPIYFSLFNYILLPWEIDNFFSDNKKKIMLVSVIVVYIVFYFYQVKQWGII